MCVGEFFFTLYFPFKTRGISTVKMAKWMCAITTLVFVAYNIQDFVIFDANIINNETYYAFIREPESYETIFTRIDSVLYSFAPFAIMVLVNGTI